MMNSAVFSGLRISSVLLGVMLATSPLVARQGTPPLSTRRAVRPLGSVQQLVLLPVDVQKELAADLRKGVGPLRFADAQQVQVSPATYGTWEAVPEGRIWRLRLISAGATDLNFGFTTFWLPEGATLHISSETEDYFEGPYTARDNKPHLQFWSPIVPGNAAVIELFVPTNAVEEPQLILGQVNRGYRDVFHRKTGTAIPKSGACEIDVVCPEGAEWTNEIRSVARITIEGTSFCTATLVANTAGDFRNYLLTANHCGINSINAATVVAYWNYQSPLCGEHGGGSLAQSQSGTTFRAAKSDVDFCLLELDDVPDPAFRVYYSGWDRSGTAPTGGVGIHHPNGDEKSISISTTPLFTMDSCIGPGSGTHWQVTWSSGVTEPGSSGSGIWDPLSHKLVGTLSGGYSDCSSPYDYDCYGKFSVSWASGTSSATRLRDWLDPLNSGAITLAGSDPSLHPILTRLSSTVVGEGCFPTNGVVDPGETVAVSFALQNQGLVPTTNLIATLQETGGVTFPGAPQTYGVIPVGGSVAEVFSLTATGTCGTTLTCVLQLNDGTNNLGTVTFPIPLGQPAGFVQNFDAPKTPSLPADWTTSPAGAWTTSTTQRDTSPNSAYAPDLDYSQDQQLISPVIPIPSPPPQLTFRHSYDFETDFDGGVLELAINGGPFVDILGTGGSFAINGYNSTLDTSWGNPLAGRSAWSGNSGGFVTTAVNLPGSAGGKNVQFRWRLGSDSSQGATGWFVDTVKISSGFTCCTGLPPVLLSGAMYNPEQHEFQFNVAGLSGASYVVEISTNLSNWVPLQTNVSPFSFLETNPPSPRFYRVRFQP